MGLQKYKRTQWHDDHGDMQLKRKATFDQSPKSPIPDLSSMHSNDVSCPYEHLLIGDFGVCIRLKRFKKCNNIGF